MSVSNKNSRIHAGVTQPHKKCSMEIKERKKKKQLPRKKIFDDRKDFVWPYQKSGMTNFDELQVNNSSHTKGTICLVNGQMAAKGMVFRAWAHERVP